MEIGGATPKARKKKGEVVEMITADEQKRIDNIEENLDTRETWTKEAYEDFYERDIQLFLGIIKKLQPKELVREVMGISPAETPALTPEQRVCVGCQECCRYLTFIVSEDIIKQYSEIYTTRGCKIRSVKYSKSSYSLRVPSLCPHLQDWGCDIYEQRPLHCKEYDGRYDPMMQDLCKLINYKKG